MKPMKRIFFGLLASLMLGSAQAHEDVVLEWNRIAFDLLLNQPPPLQMRFGAIVQLAVFEGVNAVAGEYESTLGVPRAPRDASAEAAAVSAAHRVLRTYLPDRAAEFDAARARSLARIPARTRTRCGHRGGRGGGRRRDGVARK